MYIGTYVYMCMGLYNKDIWVYLWHVYDFIMWEAIMGRNTGPGTGPTWVQIRSFVILGKLMASTLLGGWEGLMR